MRPAVFFTTMAIVLFCCGAAAEEAGIGVLALQNAADRPTLTLEQAVAIALDENPQVEAADRDVDVARSRMGEAVAGGRARVNFDASVIHLRESPTLDVPPVSLSSLQNLLKMLHPGAPIPAMNLTLPSFQLSPQDMTRYTLSVEQPLFTGGRVAHGREQVKNGVDALEAAAVSKRREIAQNVAAAYLGVVLAQRAAEVSDDAYDTIAMHVSQAEALFNQGLIPKYEYLRAQTELANYDSRRIETHNQADLAMALLLDLLDMPGTTPPVLTTPLNGEYAFDMTLNDAAAAALAASSDMRALQARDRMYEAGVDSARAGLKPVVAAVASTELRDNDLPLTTPDGFVGVVVKMPLYDGGAAHSRARYNQSLRERNQSDIERLQNGIQLEVKKYYLDLTNARQALTAAQMAVTLARESHRLAMRRFEVGEGTSIEVTDAVLGLSIAETNLLRARYQYDVAYFGIQKSIGRIVEELGGEGQ